MSSAATGRRSTWIALCRPRIVRRSLQLLYNRHQVFLPPLGTVLICACACPRGPASYVRRLCPLIFSALANSAPDPGPLWFARRADVDGCRTLARQRHYTSSTGTSTQRALEIYYYPGSLDDSSNGSRFYAERTTQVERHLKHDRRFNGPLILFKPTGVRIHRTARRVRPRKASGPSPNRSATAWRLPIDDPPRSPLMALIAQTSPTSRVRHHSPSLSARVPLWVTKACRTTSAAPYAARSDDHRMPAVADIVARDARARVLYRASTNNPASSSTTSVTRVFDSHRGQVGKKGIRP